MKFLIVGAGALGGYFGARLLEAGKDVTFLLRPGRAAQLAKTGLVVKSALGDAHLPSPPHVLKDGIKTHFDVILVGCKAYDLADTMESFAAAVGPHTMIVPMLNGMRHLELLGQRFDPSNVLGGLCVISAALDPQGTIVHFNDTHRLTFGELDGSRSSRIEALEGEWAGVNSEIRASEAIRHEMWEKWTLIASAAGITCLMRAAIGDIVAAGAADLATGMFEECCRIASAAGFTPRAGTAAEIRATLTQAGSPITASMFKDVERKAPTEADHVLGDLLTHARAKQTSAPLLGIAYAHLKAYEARRLREAAEQAS